MLGCKRLNVDKEFDLIQEQISQLTIVVTFKLLLYPQNFEMHYTSLVNYN